MPFSDRTPEDLSHNLITQAMERAAGRAYLDLTESNPTRCGFNYPPDLLRGLSQPENLLYEPFPFGHPEARQAVADCLTGKGRRVEANSVLLAASTSEAYSYLFKLLADPGDSLLVSTPGYPLLDHLARLEAVELLPYPLKTEPGWPLDLVQLEKAIRPGTKAVIVVSPHNPTGSILSINDHKALDALCQKNGMALVLDEVFADFAYSIPPPTPIEPQALTFRLGGLSKSLGLPQLKLSWIVLEGPKDLVSQAQERLELIADTYLSVNGPVQKAAKDLLKFAPDFQKQVQERLQANRSLAEKALGKLPGVKVWPAQGGWYLLVELEKSGKTDEEWVIELLEKKGLLVQPGGFYDFLSGTFLVISLLPQTSVFQDGLGRIREHLKA
jgi:alanine-synthesizing transaminase